MADEPVKFSTTLDGRPLVTRSTVPFLDSCQALAAFGFAGTVERPRKCLVAFVMAKHHGVTEVDLCRRLGWARPTFMRHKMAGATIIAEHLNRLKLPAWA